MTVKFAHCLFEQSGTFKRAFEDFGIQAYDYDIGNDYGETDILVDIFAEIEYAFSDKISLFDDIDKDDVIVAFFPCIYFCEASSMYFMGVSANQRGMSNPDKILDILERERYRHVYYRTLLKLCHVCEVRGLRLIVENPYNAHHYLRFNFPYKPAVIDMNRRLHGDSVKKPTQYLFINCKPAGKHSMTPLKPMQYTRSRRCAAKAGTCSVDRSMIDIEYARNFIADHILGIDTKYTIKTLFD